MSIEFKSMINLRKTDEKNNGTVLGIHLEVEEDFEIVQDRGADVVGFIHNNNRSNTFGEPATGNLFLNQAKIVHFAVRRLHTEVQGQVFVEFLHGQSREAAVNNLVQRWIEARGPVVNNGSFPVPGPPVNRPKPFVPVRIPSLCFASLASQVEI